MRSQLITYYLRRFVNQIVDSTLSGPSLAEMVNHHLEADWTRMHVPPYAAVYKVFDREETFLELRVTDARGYEDRVYDRGCALLKIGVNGALTAPEDEAYARQLFPTQAFRTCPTCKTRFHNWFDYYGHIKLDHLGSAS